VLRAPLLLQVVLFAKQTKRKIQIAGQSIERREVLRILAVAAGAATFPGFSKWAFACNHIGNTFARIKSAVYRPVFFTPPEYAVIERLTDLIIPADDTAGARDAGVSEFLDLMVSRDLDLQRDFRTGLSWLDLRSQKTLGKTFLMLSADQQTALAELLFGDYSPSGKLPASFELRWEDNPTLHSYYPEKGEKRVQYSEGIFVGYRHFDGSETKPLFAFGYGLSYTTFGYNKLSVAPQTGNLNDPITVSFDVKNTGHREAAEVAELYVGQSHPSVPRPVKELKGFAKVNLKPGESKRVTLKLDRRAFSFYDVNKSDWTAEAGEFTIQVGGSSDNIQLREKFTLTH
jgi:hypothetical protein